MTFHFVQFYMKFVFLLRQLTACLSWLRVLSACQVAGLLCHSRFVILLKIGVNLRLMFLTPTVGRVTASHADSVLEAPSCILSAPGLGKLPARPLLLREHGLG